MVRTIGMGAVVDNIAAISSEPYFSCQISQVVQTSPQGLIGASTSAASHGARSLAARHRTLPTCRPSWEAPTAPLYHLVRLYPPSSMDTSDLLGAVPEQADSDLGGTGAPLVLWGRKSNHRRKPFSWCFPTLTDVVRPSDEALRRARGLCG